LNNIDGWLLRHKNIDFLGWDIKEIRIILDNILNEKVEYVNDILGLLPNKNIDELYDILKIMKIGNKHQFFKKQCTWCGKDIKVFPKDYYKDHLYCNLECRDKYRSKYYRGSSSPSYTSIATYCTNCNKEIHIPQNKVGNKNTFGDEHHFCSQNCYYDFRKKYYVKDKNIHYGKVLTKKEKEFLKKIAIKALTNGNKITKPHKKINDLLDKLKVSYINEKNIKYYCWDIFLDKYNLYVEIMGDYFHSNPNIYLDSKKLDSIQRKDLKRDKSKRTYLKKYLNKETLYLWESDINNNIELCEKIIMSFIKNNGILENYNSFNYYLDNNNLRLMDEIIYPYYEIKTIKKP
jgi:hypothetical protein